MKFYDIKDKPFEIYGVFFDEKEGKFFRMEKSVADTVSANISMLCSNTSGGRVKFSTNSREIAVKFTCPVKPNYYHFSTLATIACILNEERDGEQIFMHSYVPNNLYNFSAENTENGYTVSAKVGDGKMRNYVLYFPNYCDVCSIEIGLDDGAKIEKGNPYREKLPILYYGSSITQGACASRSDLCYPALISKWNNLDYKNLGFSGSAKGEPEIADYLAEQKCCLFVCDYDYNSQTAEHLNSTHYPIYEKFRAKNPDTPILFVTSAYTPKELFEVTARSDAKEFYEIEERVAIIKKTYYRAKKNGDKNVYFLDGRTFFKKNERGYMSEEGLHPNDTGFYFMAKAIYKAMCKIDKKFM